MRKRKTASTNVEIPTFSVTPRVDDSAPPQSSTPISFTLPRRTVNHAYALVVQNKAIPLLSKKFLNEKRRLLKR